MSTYVTPTKAFAHLHRLAKWQGGLTPAPVTIEADLSNRCYLRCHGCHFAYTHTRGPWTTVLRRVPIGQDRSGDMADVAVTTRWLSEAAACGVKGVIWTGGGEPTLHPAWTSIVTHAQAVGLEQGMYTAGGLLTRDTARLLADVASWVVVSLDYADAESYAAAKGASPTAFDAACRGLRWVAEHQQAIVGASFLLSASNWTKAGEMLQLARTLGASYTTFRPMIETQPDRPGVVTADRAWISDALPMLRQYAALPDVECDPARFVEYRDWTGHGYRDCHGIKLTTTITPDGRMWVCPNRREFPDSCLGDLRAESFAAIWARHPKTFCVSETCRAMCRLHLQNGVLNEVFAPKAHEAFV